MVSVTDPRRRSGEDVTWCHRSQRGQWGGHDMVSQITDRGTFQAAGVNHRVGWRSLGGWYFNGCQKQKLGSCGCGGSGK